LVAALASTTDATNAADAKPGPATLPRQAPAAPAAAVAAPNSSAEAAPLAAPPLGRLSPYNGGGALNVCTSETIPSECVTRGWAGTRAS
jgi:hypothetical protein